ncbi:MAG: ribonuclease HII [Acidimicrobiales bacterium]
MTSGYPTTEAERSLAFEGFGLIAGLDEVGRGAWAGPVSVGVVLVPTATPAPEGLRDSKLVPEDQREAMFPLVVAWCTDWAVGHAGPEECDRWGMTVALRLAARRALDGLRTTPDVVLLDGSFDYLTESGELPGGAAPSPPVRTIVRGDTTCTSIAAASIVAKVTRDRMMRDLAEHFPAFDFDRNKGYPSPVHRTALVGRGLTSIHRRSWSYVDQLPFR